MSLRSRLLLVAGGAFAFGVIAAIVAGQDSDGLSTAARVRGNIGNLSAPWLILALLAGAAGRSWRRGIVLGSVATMSGLLGWYLLTALVMDTGREGLVDSLTTVIAGNRLWFALGALSGPVFGAVGGWSGGNAWLAGGIIGGALMIGEPVVMAGIDWLLPATSVGRDGAAVGVDAAQAALGLAVVVVAWTRLSSTRTTAGERTVPGIGHKQRFD
jgi:hypothetical protein